MLLANFLDKTWNGQQFVLCSINNSQKESAMNKPCFILSASLLGMSASGLAQASTVTEYPSIGSWLSSASNVTSYTFSGAPNNGVVVFGAGTVTFGPGIFSATSGNGKIFNDNFYGSGVQYVSDDPGGGVPGARVSVAFSSPADVTGLEFTLGSFFAASSVSISVNGTAIPSVTVSAGAPTTVFLGVTSGTPITNITFGSTSGEMDLVGGYSTSTTVPLPAAAWLMLSGLGGLVSVCRKKKAP
jgi:hypothetical protein